MAQIQTRCPSCGHVAKTGADRVGTRARCRECQKPFTVSVEAAASTEEAAPNSPGRKAGLLAVIAVVALAAIGGGAWFAIGALGNQKLRKAHELYAAGKRPEAVAIYKASFSRFDDKGEVVKRIVEFEIDKGNTEEAVKWIRQGLDMNLALQFDYSAADSLANQVKKEPKYRQREEEAAARKKEEQPRKNPVAQAKSEPKPEPKSQPSAEVKKVDQEPGPPANASDHTLDSLRTILRARRVAWEQNTARIKPGSPTSVQQRLQARAIDDEARKRIEAIPEWAAISDGCRRLLNVTDVNDGTIEALQTWLCAHRGVAQAQVSQLPLYKAVRLMADK